MLSYYRTTGNVLKAEALRILNKKRNNSGASSSSQGGTTVGGRGIKRAFPGSTGREQHMSKGDSETQLDSDTSSDISKSSFMIKGNTKDSKDSARRRFVWSVPLHQDFVAAVFDIGLKCASPKLLLEMMPVVDGLTSEHIKSHLQKYRLHRQRSREEFLKSYGYLTDLDGGKGLGGGSAAAAIKVAAAVASEVKGGVPRSYSDPSSESQKGGCDMKCECYSSSTTGAAEGAASPSNTTAAPAPAEGREALTASDDTSMECNREVDLPPKISTSGGSGGAVEADNVAAVTSETRQEELEESNDRVGDKEAEGSPQPTQDVGAEVDANELPQQIFTGNVQIMTNSLVQSHLELLARGINMQIRFHHHLRQVVESQQRLPVESHGRQRRHQSPSPRNPGSPRVITNSADTSIPTTTGPSQIDQPMGGLREPESNGSTRYDEGLADSAGFSGEFAGLPDDLVYAATTPGSFWEISGAGKILLSEAIADANGLLGVTSAGSGQGMKPSSSPSHASDVGLDNAASGAAHASCDDSRDIAPPIDLRYKPRARDAGPNHFNAAALPPTHNRPNISGLRVTMPQQGYVPGKYTRRCRVPDAVVGGKQPHARGPTEAVRLRAAHPGMAAAECRAEACAGVETVTDLMTSATPTGTLERESMALKRHMQAQMEMHRSLLGSSAEQANNGAGERFPITSRGLPVHAEVGGGGNVGSNGRIEAMGASVNNGAGGEIGGPMSGGSGRLGVGGAAGSHHHLHECAETSALLGLLQDNDMLDLNWLDRSGELKPVDHQVPAPARQAGEEQPSLLSFLNGIE